MLYQTPYSIQLLNDLHNHFPEILYNSGRFQTVADLLAYIREVAATSPYHQAYNQYLIRQNARVRQNATTIPSFIPQPPLAGTTAAAPSIPQVSQTFVTFEDQLPQTTRVRMSVNNPLNNNALNSSLLINTLLGGLFGDILGTPINGGNPLQDFLNQRVPIFPTNEEIENASIIFRPTRQQDDLCAICQDEFEINQNVRRLTHCNHSFHQDCIDTWFRTNVHCPTCRHDIREVTNNRTTDNRNPPPVPDNHRRTNVRRPDTQ